MIPLTYKKEEILKILDRQIAKATKADEKAAAKHKVDERKYHKLFQQVARQAAKLSYEEAKAADFRLQWPKHQYYAPSCPAAEAYSWVMLRGLVSLGSSATIRITRNGKYHKLWELLTKKVEADAAATRICE